MCGNQPVAANRRTTANRQTTDSQRIAGLHFSPKTQCGLLKTDLFFRRVHQATGGKDGNRIQHGDRHLRLRTIPALSKRTAALTRNSRILVSLAQRSELGFMLAAIFAHNTPDRDTADITLAFGRRYTNLDNQRNLWSLRRPAGRSRQSDQSIEMQLRSGQQPMPAVPDLVADDDAFTVHYLFSPQNFLNLVYKKGWGGLLLVLAKLQLFKIPPSPGWPFRGDRPQYSPTAPAPQALKKLLNDVTRNANGEQLSGRTVRVYWGWTQS